MITLKEIISASRRTDLPQWFLPEVLRWFKQGFVDVPNPFSRKLYRVELVPAAVHSIVWWSKDFSRWLERASAFEEYTNTFQFTINTEQGTFLEPGIRTTLDERIAQFLTLVDQYGADAVNWRFDPIVFWDEGRANNLVNFDYIVQKLAPSGITSMAFSFATWYGKCVKRTQRRSFRFHQPSLDQMARTLSLLASTCANSGIAMRACCNPEIEQLGIENIARGRCIDGELLSKVAGTLAATQQDTGQRDACQCTRSRDIGRYDMVCKHGCLYCYANPQL